MNNFNLEESSALASTTPAEVGGVDKFGVTGLEVGCDAGLDPDGVAVPEEGSAEAIVVGLSLDKVNKQQDQV